MEITSIASLIYMAGILIASLDLVILIGSKNLSSRVFALLTFITAIWVVSQGFLISTNLESFSNFLIRTQYILGIIIAIGFYFFSIVYPYDKKITYIRLFLGIFISILFSIFYFFTNILISGTTYIGGIGHWSWQFGSLNWVFNLAFCSLWIIALFRIFKSYKAASGELRANMRNMFLALILGIIPPTLFNILLPAIGYYALNWLGPLASAFWIFIIAHSIIRYRQMDVRVVITEVLALAMAIIFFINIFADFSLGVWDNVAEFLIFLVLAIYLIRGVLREAKQREELNDLNQNLEAKVAAKTVEVRKALEQERHARMELEKLNDAKNQFVMLTQHNMRTPVSSITATVKTVLGETHDHLPLEIRQAFEDIRYSAGRLTKISDEFLNITTMKPGGSILTLKQASLKSAVEDILAELKVPIKEMSLRVEYPHENEKWPDLLIDFPKIRECLFIILDNAVHYNQKNGFIRVESKAHKDSFILQISNSGLGISKDESEKIGSALFYRGERARKAYSVGMGVGLSMVRTIINAHRGTFEITSDGPGKGAVATVTLPL